MIGGNCELRVLRSNEIKDVVFDREKVVNLPCIGGNTAENTVETNLVLVGIVRIKTTGWDEGTKNGPDRSALLGHNFVYQETKPHGFYSSYFHQRISS